MSEKYLTKEGLEKLKNELEKLKKEDRQKVAKQLETAISFGDLSENAAYDEAKEEQALLEGKIAEIESIINNAIIVKSPKKSGWVQIGSSVTVNFGGKKETYQIVGEEESNPLEKKISYRSPIGKALMEKPEGAKVKVTTPKGDVVYDIIKID